MPDPVLDPSTPCCLDFSKIATKAGQCALATKLLTPGGTGGTAAPASGTWSSSLNAANGGTGGGGGSSWSEPDPIILEAWI